MLVLGDGARTATAAVIGELVAIHVLETFESPRAVGTPQMCVLFPHAVLHTNIRGFEILIKPSIIYMYLIYTVRVFIISDINGLKTKFSFLYSTRRVQNKSQYPRN